MGLIGDGLERALQEVFTRPIPKTAGGQMRYLVGQVGGTRQAAQLLGTSQRTVERYVKGQLKTPRGGLAARLENAVRARWQPGVRGRAMKAAAAAKGIVIETRAAFGYTAAPGTTDDPRMRRITQSLPPEYANRLFTAYKNKAPESELAKIVAQGLQDMYFRDGGRRAGDLEVEFTDIDYIDFDL
ncbi:telomere-protecting terminal protein Tpg [Streptomyces sp. NPDC051016]|uniref:telomere-protecting terminal protein Tpg n=1 Tax=Streptomyces sp. NPDC051016 TaxID=3365638 RepID=UPI0037A838D2